MTELVAASQLSDRIQSAVAAVYALHQLKTRVDTAIKNLKFTQHTYIDWIVLRISCEGRPLLIVAAIEEVE